MPRLWSSTTNEQAIENFQTESSKILKLARALPPENLCQRRLIPRVRGIEDSSRYWSVAMTLEHLVIVGDLMRVAIISLSRGQGNDRVVGTADVKPIADINPENIMRAFEQMSEKFFEETSKATIDAFPKVTYQHPWFGKMNAHQWLALAPAHQHVHRTQIKAIIARL